MKRLLFALFASCFLCGNTLSTRIENARVGSYIVTEAKKNYTLLHIHTQTEDNFILEEITAPAHIVGKNFDWKAWVEKGAPGHSGWTLYEIEHKTGQILECFSFTHQSWMQAEGDASFLTKLMYLPLTPISEKERKRIGAEPPHHAIDIRKIWNPPKIVDGQRVLRPAFEVSKTVWPKDDSELSKRKIEMYFDATAPRFPFPYWIEVQGMIDQKVRSVDSGYNLKSPRSHMPRRFPTPLGHYEKSGENLTLKIDTPLYYKDFELFETKDQTSIKPCHVVRSGKIIELILNAKELDKDATHTLTPKSHPHIFVELPPLPK